MDIGRETKTDVYNQICQVLSVGWKEELDTKVNRLIISYNVRHSTLCLPQICDNVYWVCVNICIWVCPGIDFMVLIILASSLFIEGYNFFRTGMSLNKYTPCSNTKNLHTFLHNLFLPSPIQSQSNFLSLVRVSECISASSLPS